MFPSDGNSMFIPIHHSGSCSEIGSKPYMEDEHICVDNLLEHLGATTNFPSPTAFYGVCNFILQHINMFVTLMTITKPMVDWWFV